MALSLIPAAVHPPDLGDAIVVKERQPGRGLHGTTRVVSGSIAQVEATLQVSPGSWTMHTYGVERTNLTVRQPARRLGRQGNAFSKEPADLEPPLTLAFAYSHCVDPHRR